MARTITFSEDVESGSLFLTYAPSSDFDVLCAKLGVAWDDAGNLIKCALDDLSCEQIRLRGSRTSELGLLVKRVFHFTQTDLIYVSRLSEEFIFLLAQEAYLGDFRYYRIPARILGITQEVFIDADCSVTQQWIDFFCTGYMRRTSVFKKISDVVSPSEPCIIVGGKADGAIPWETFERMLVSFPTTRKLDLLGQRMLSDCIEEFLVPKKDYTQDYLNYMKKVTAAAKAGSPVVPLGSDAIALNLGRSLSESIEVVSKLLERGEESAEDEWQKVVFRILPVIFPQYIAVLREVIVPETFSKKGKVTNRKLDYVLVDASGNIDIIEMKRAFGNDKLLQRRTYRDNWVPARELSGGIAQIEQYIYYLQHLGSEGERELSDYCKGKLRAQGVLLPDSLTLRCLNPRGILMMGNPKFDANQQHGFDIIRRQYAHVVDIITYDDLLARLTNMRAALGAAPSGGSKDWVAGVSDRAHQYSHSASHG